MHVITGLQAEPKAVKRTVAPTGDPDTPNSDTEVKDFLKVDGTDEDGLITALNIACTEAAENFTKRAFLTQTWRMVFDATPFNILAVPSAPSIIK
ncbi:MAG: phage gp6-like head-tail connector protein, partial [Gemmatimonadetes bacterium]|nr:phage gp6-like head-tail connector protein [Gemmatimonadota bacterium]